MTPQGGPGFAALSLKLIGRETLPGHEDVQGFGFEQLLLHQVLHDLYADTGGDALHASQRVSRITDAATHMLNEQL